MIAALEEKIRKKILFYHPIVVYYDPFAVLIMSYDKETFAAKINLLLTHFIDMAVQGYGWVAA